jgi:hypothetical protein
MDNDPKRNGPPPLDLFTGSRVTVRSSSLVHSMFIIWFLCYVGWRAAVAALASSGGLHTVTYGGNRRFTVAHAPPTLAPSLRSH